MDDAVFEKVRCRAGTGVFKPLIAGRFVTKFVIMELVTKTPRPRAKCEWCRAPFKPKPLGRAPKFCSAKCRQAACVKRNGTWETLMRQAQQEKQQKALVEGLRAQLRPIVRRELTREFIQSGLVRITGPDHVTALIAGRNEWRGNKLLDELAHDFAAAGNQEAYAAIGEWQRLAKQTGSGKRSSSRRQQPQNRLLALPPE